MDIFRRAKKGAKGESEAGRLSEAALGEIVQNFESKLRNIQYRLGHLERIQQSVSKGEQMLLSFKYKELAASGTVLGFDEVGFQNFSQFEEDGIIHYIFSLIGEGNRWALEFCAGVGSESMSANLILNHRWMALLIDGNEANVKAGINFFERHPSTSAFGPIFQCRWLRRDNINDILREAQVCEKVDLLTLDLDGVDYWVWDAITAVSPRMVIVEFIDLFPDRAITVPYAPEFKAKWIPLHGARTQDKAVEGQLGKAGSWALYGGATLRAFNKLGNSKGYRLIGANSRSINAFFMRNDVGTEYFPEVSIESCLGGCFNPQVAALAEEKLSAYEWVEV